jgi:hypothetical protein
VPFDQGIPQNPPVLPRKRGAEGEFKKAISKDKIDDLVKNRNSLNFVIPAEAGIQLNQAVLDSRLRGSDGHSDFLRIHQN